MDLRGDTVGSLCAVVGAATALTGAAAVYYISKMPDPTCIPPIDLADQSMVLPDGSRCSKMMKDGKLMEHFYDDMNTLYEAFMRGLKESSGSGPCLGTRSGPKLEYEWMSYQEVYDNSQAVGSWFVDQGLKSGAQSFVGIYSQNRTEWVLAEKGCCFYNLVAVSLFDTLGNDAIVFILNQTALPILVVDNAVKVKKILNMVEERKVRSLKTLVVMEMADVDQTWADKLGIQIVAFKDVLDIGRKLLKPVTPPGRDDLAMLCYTSGTTGSNPKGVMITHKQAVSNISAIYYIKSVGKVITKDDVHVSYMPLAHMYERLGQVMFYMHGARVGFFRGDPKLLVEDMQALKPTIFLTVPRLLNKLYDKIMAGTSQSKIKSAVLRWALNAKMKEVRKFVIRKDSFWDKILFKKIQALLGGNVNTVITGSAPLAAEVLDFYRCALGCIVMEGYGQSECAAGVSFSVPGEIDSGIVGPPLPCNYVKLVDVPEYGYYAANNQGEICVKGPNTTPGYYKDPERTAELLDSNGWLHSGDIGQWMPNGTLKIIDRKKNIFKLSQGEYIAPEKLETVYCRSVFVAQAYVDGDSLKAYCMGIVIPEEEVLMSWAKSKNIGSTFQELCQSESVKNMILADIYKQVEVAQLSGIERVKDIALHPELFSIENGLLTPTFKNKRPLLNKFFKKHIDNLYQKHADM